MSKEEAEGTWTTGLMVDWPAKTKEALKQWRVEGRTIELALGREKDLPLYSSIGATASEFPHGPGRRNPTPALVKKQVMTSKLHPHPMLMPNTSQSPQLCTTRNLCSRDPAPIEAIDAIESGSLGWGESLLFSDTSTDMIRGLGGRGISRSCHG